MNINFALSQFKKSPYTKLKFGTKAMDVIITGYSKYKDGILLIPQHASMLPDSYLYFVDIKGNVKEVSPTVVAMDSSAGRVQSIDK